MRTFAARIRRELRESVLPIPYCAIYEEELGRFWPLELPNREAEMERFAKQYGFKLRFYMRGFFAIFQEDPAKSSRRIKSQAKSNAPKGRRDCGD
jgi:hypothetical protein